LIYIIINDFRNLNFQKELSKLSRDQEKIFRQDANFCSLIKLFREFLESFQKKLFYFLQNKMQQKFIMNKNTFAIL
jgi:hypothetical protein